MREAFELSYACAMMFAKTRVQLIAMDELAFKHPVPIGSILEYSAQVTFTETTGEGQVIHVEVRMLLKHFLGHCGCRGSHDGIKKDDKHVSLHIYQHH